MIVALRVAEWRFSQIFYLKKTGIPCAPKCNGLQFINNRSSRTNALQWTGNDQS